MYSKREYIKENINIINDLISKNIPKFEISRILGVKYSTLNKYLKEFGIDYAGNPNRKGILRLSERTPITEFLKKNGKFITASKLRNRLLEEGFKEEKCEKCGSVMLEKGNKLVCFNEECGNVINKSEEKQEAEK